MISLCIHRFNPPISKLDILCAIQLNISPTLNTSNHQKIRCLCFCSVRLIGYMTVASSATETAEASKSKSLDQWLLIKYKNYNVLLVLKRYCSFAFLLLLWFFVARILSCLLFFIYCPFYHSFLASYFDTCWVSCRLKEKN